MLFRQRFYQLIAEGRVDVAFRRWRRPTVRAGGTLRTPIGVLAIDGVRTIEPAEIGDADAARAGFASPAELLAELDQMGGEGRLHRIDFHLGGADPRLALRDRTDLDDGERAEVAARLQRLDAASSSGPWTAATLALLAAQPGVRAGDLAPRFQLDLLTFKRRVRKLKELGLTESLEVGYRLSPRGRAIIAPSGTPGSSAPDRPGR